MKLSEVKKEMDRIADQFDVDADDIHLNIDRIEPNIKGCDQNAVVVVEVTEKGSVWVGSLPEVDKGDDVVVIGKSKKDAMKCLEIEFYGCREVWGSSEPQWKSFKVAMEYFGGKVYEQKLNEIMEI